VFSRIPHVLRGLDRRDEFENDIANPNNTNYGSENIVENVNIEEEGAEEKVDCATLDRGIPIGSRVERTDSSPKEGEQKGRISR
jgi:hypothetical protein